MTFIYPISKLAERGARPTRSDFEVRNGPPRQESSVRSRDKTEGAGNKAVGRSVATREQNNLKRISLAPGAQTNATGEWRR